MTRPRLGRPARVSALVAGAVLALAGCSVVPGAAAVVDGQRITDDRVDGTARALCAANLAGAAAQGQPRPELATRGARQAALSLLIDSELSRRFGEAQGIEPSPARLSAAVEQNRQAVGPLPEDVRDDFDAVLRDYLSGQLILEEAGLRAAGPGAAPEEVQTAGVQARNEWVAQQDLEVEVDPRFGSYGQGGLEGSSGSLSIPASERAKAGDTTQPGPEWVSDLPPTQQCG